LAQHKHKFSTIFNFYYAYTEHMHSNNMLMLS
jgi:hypothetical protein